MKDGIAIVGMACIYPDARNPRELWENALAQRRAFRRIPRERLRLEDYFSTDRSLPDTIYSTEAALISDYEFDRLRYKVVGSTYRSADLTHWLALDVASMALTDAGFPEADGLPREETAVILGNTLTGEFSRANLMRLRWPYVRRVVHAELLAEGWSPEQSRKFLDGLETNYKKPFPAPGEETLAGGLSNTIAGRVCNHFDLKGGGYTVDGACAASLLAVTNACAALRDGDVSVVLAGGVDLSLDPFELVGFARAGALASDLMRLYDVRSGGFWPGEGCGFVVLMREQDAVAQDRRIYGVIRGWGISSDGSGGITRPEIAGQKLALERAYRRAGFGPDRVGYFEGHGTGTAIGDATELRVLSDARRAAGATTLAAIGSIKANIGHTKAAAGIAGFIKATMALHEGAIPPTTACFDPHTELKADNAALRVPRFAEQWAMDDGDCAAVSAMGFGGINTHVVIQSAASGSSRMPRRKSPQTSQAYQTQDAELILFAADTASDLRSQIERLLPRAAELSRAEVSDAAASLAERAITGEFRAALVAATPAQLFERLTTLLTLLDNGMHERFQTKPGVFVGRCRSKPRVGFLFPGQASPSHPTGGALRRRFASADQTYSSASLPLDGDQVSTELAQPAIVTAACAALQVLAAFGVEADVAVGHSLGELTALHWAGCFDADALLALARARGKAMADLPGRPGAMASLRADEQSVRAMLGDIAGVLIAGINSPRQTVVSGPADAVDRAIQTAKVQGIAGTRLPVSHAFHSPLVADAASALRAHINSMHTAPPGRTVVSTIIADVLSKDVSLADLLCQQLTSPVRFIEATSRGFADCDLVIEVGPGEVLAGLAGDFLTPSVFSTDAGCESLAPFLGALGAAFVAGVNIRHDLLYRDRLIRPIDLTRRPSFFVNPCELAPLDGEAGEPAFREVDMEREVATKLPYPSAASDLPESRMPEQVIRKLIAERTELPGDAISADQRLLADLHLNSISVGQIVADAARGMGLPNPVSPTAYANATVGELTAALESWVAEASRGKAPHIAPHTVAGVEAWIRPLAVELVEQPLTVRPATEVGGGWRVFAADGHPLKASLSAALARAGAGGGVALCMPVDPGETDVPLLLHAARSALSQRAGKLLVVQSGGGGSSLARTLHLEQPSVDVAVVDVPFDCPDSVLWAAAEASAASGYVEAHYNSEGTRSVPQLHPVWVEKSTAWPLGPDDVLLVTGGGKGIAAECALHLANVTAVKLAIIGRSDPMTDDEVAQTLERLTAAGVKHCYERADVCDNDAVKSAVRAASSKLGAISAVLHASGVNEPALIEAMDESIFVQTVRTKVAGLGNVLSALDPSRLRLLVSFGSIIARTGLPGEAHYAVANDWLARDMKIWGRRHPHCRCLTLDWSVWQSIGMGHRLGRVESLMQQGVTPIPTDEGLSWLGKLLKWKNAPPRVIVAGRFGSLPTLGRRTSPLPLLRFIERPRVDYPGVELVVDAEVSQTTDPYVREHALHRESLFPAVMGLEAMAQAAIALANRNGRLTIRDVELHRPIVVPNDGTLTLRLAALMKGPHCVEVVLRSSATDFQVDYFRATIEFEDESISQAPQPLEIYLGNNGHALIPLQTESDVYGDMLFHEGRFRRVRGYRSLMARHCLAELTPPGRDDWFAAYLPARLVLGDPGARDAAIHAIQSCIPHARLLPIAVKRIRRFAPPETCARSIRAIETAAVDGVFTYDMQMLDENDRVIEAWSGLQLRVIEPIALNRNWNAALLSNYVDRRAGELLGRDSLSIVIEDGVAPDRTGRSDHAISMALGEAGSLTRREDGKPLTSNGRHVSSSHAGPLTMAVAAAQRAGCDIEPVAPRDEQAWRGLLNDAGQRLAALIAESSRECRNTSGTRVWSATECLKKAGFSAVAPLTLDAATDDGWVMLRSGDQRIATFAALTQNFETPLVIAVLAGASS